MPHSKYILIGASSTIGHALAKGWLESGIKVHGTYRVYNDNCKELLDLGAVLHPCDVADPAEVRRLSEVLANIKWQVFTYLPASLDPVGPFAEIDIDAWERSFQLNFHTPLQILQSILPNAEDKASILFWAGGGVNSAPVNCSAYTISKIALIKMVEILNAEQEHLKPSIIGPGWVNAPIHQKILQAGQEKAGPNYQQTLNKLNSGDFTSLKDVVDCTNWIISQPKHIVGGRNISVVYDDWKNKDLTDMLAQDQDMYKLRRQGNNLIRK